MTAPQTAASRPAPPASPGAALRMKIDLAMPALRTASAALWAAPDLPRRYACYLQVMHQMVRATVPLIAAAISQCEQRADDPVAAALLSYLREHFREEAGHDDWVRRDLRLIRDDADELLSVMPGPAVANAVGAQYYWLLNHHPVCLLGHIAVLEGYPPSPAMAATLAARTGLPGKAFRALHAHAVLDPRHRDDLFHAIDALPLSAGQQAALGVSALHTVASLVTVFDELLAAPLPPAGRTSPMENTKE